MCVYNKTNLILMFVNKFAKSLLDLIHNGLTKTCIL